MNKIINAPSPNYNDRRNNASVNMLVLHYTGMPTSEDALNRMLDEKSEVSAHYMINEKGDIFKLVDEDKRAWHAGVSFWGGITDINSASIGIEIVNKGHEFGYHNFPKEQMQSVISLSQDILKRHNIPARNVVGHSDVAPIRKTDPGELFDWKLLHKNNIGIWTDKEEPNKEITLDDAIKLLSKIGYDISDINAAIIAFKRHFMPWNELSSEADNDTIFRIYQISCLL